MRVLLALGAIAGMFALACLTVGEAHEIHAGASDDLKAWVRGLTDKKGVGCCDQADGYPAEVDWDMATGKYRVRIEGEWYVVPDEAVIEQPNRLGYATVWWTRNWALGGSMIPNIRCFLPGSSG